jgi:hypothetical protein
MLQPKCGAGQKWMSRLLAQFSIFSRMIEHDRVRSENKKSGPDNHLRHGARAFAPTPLTQRETLCERAVRWILPWTVRNYPGVHRGMVELMGMHVTYSAIKGWRTGRRPMSRWAADTMATAIRARCRKGLELAAELDEWSRQRARIEDELRELRRRQLNAIRARRLTNLPSD